MNGSKKTTVPGLLDEEQALHSTVSLRDCLYDRLWRSVGFTTTIEGSTIVMYCLYGFRSAVRDHCNNHAVLVLRKD